MVDPTRDPKWYEICSEQYIASLGVVPRMQYRLGQIVCGIVQEW